MTLHNNKQPGDLIKSAEHNDDLTGLSTGDYDEDQNSLAIFRSQIGNYLQNCVWDAPGADLNLNMSAGLAVINGLYIQVDAVTAHAFAPSQDTYVDIGIDGVVDYNPVTNGDTAPALEANHIRIAKIVTDADNVTEVTQNQASDSRGANIIYPRPFKTIESQSALQGLWGIGGEVMKDANAIKPTGPGLPLFLFQAGSISLTHNASGNATLTFPAPFPNGVLSIMGSQGGTAAGNRGPNFNSVTKSTANVNYNGFTGGAVRTNYLIIGW